MAFSAKSIYHDCKLPALSMRLVWVDIWKGVLITLVVAGHVAGMAAHYVSPEVRPVCEQLFKYIYSFHMSAFFLLAGLMWKDVDDWRQYLVRKGKSIVVPYLIFGIASIVVYFLTIGIFSSVVASHQTDGHYAIFKTSLWWHPLASLVYGAPFPGTDGFRCNTVLWFLPCFYVVHILFLLVWKVFARYRKWAIPTFFALSSYLGFLLAFRVSLPWGLSFAFWYLQFFIAGQLLASLTRGVDKIETKVSMPLLIFVFILTLAMWWLTTACVGDVVYDRMKFIGHIHVAASGLLGAVMSALLSLLIARIKWCTGAHAILASWGCHSLGIMLVHKYPVLFLMLMLPIVRQTLSLSRTGACIVLLAVTVVSLMLSWLVSLIICHKFAFVFGRSKR